jgi:transcription elongation factor SPT5
MSLVFQIYRRWTLRSVDLDVTSIFARDGIPGYIFLEGSYADVQRAISNLVTVIANSRQRLVTLEQRVALLNSHNPMSRAIKEGEWVRVNYGLYREDVGFVCGRCDSSDLDIIVALIPRIATKNERRRVGHIGKRKRPIRPAPRLWSETELVHEWGPEKVQNISPDAFKFRNETYESGLLMAHYSSSLLVIVKEPPSTFPIFSAASSVGERPSFVVWRHRLAQASLQPGQRVKVETGELQGLVGFINEIIEDGASIIPEEGDTLQVMPHVLLSSLAPHYLPGDNVKARWMDSHGIVVSVNDTDQKLVYVRSNPVQEVKCFDFTVTTTDRLVDYDFQGSGGISRSSASAGTLSGRNLG